MLQPNAVKMKIVCFVVFVVQCSCSKSGDDLKIPNVGELIASGTGYVGNIGGNYQNGGGPNSIGNIANIAQSNIGPLGPFGNLGNNGNSGGGSGSQGSNGGGGPNSVGNIANIAQSNIGGPQGNGNIGNIANIGQNNINGNNNYYYDEKRNIERPCHVYDTFCIRKYLAEHSKCKEVYGRVPDPMYRAQSTQYIPRINLTATGLDNLYGGLNGRIEEFYINRETDNLVLAIGFRNLTFYSRNAFFRFERRGREPIVTNDFSYIYYPSLVTTIVIPNSKDLQLQKSEAFTYINALPFFLIGRNAIILDPIVIRTLLELFLNYHTSDGYELNLTEGPYYASTFIQHQLCDFGYKVL